MDLNEIQNHLDNIMSEQNNRTIPDFEGYSPFEMHQILHFTFEADSPIKLQKITDLDYKNIPLLNQIKYLTNLISVKGEIKLTNKGFLPTNVVSDIYQQRFLTDEYIERGISKLYKETDSLTINLTRLLIELAGIAKKRTGKLSLTKKGEKILSNDQKLLKTIIEIFASKFNWAYYDGFGENHIGQLGYGFSLILLSKYGDKNRLDSFYSEKYFKAFPQLLDSIEPTYGTLESYSTRCYSLRTFDRFLDFFGLINIEQERNGLDTIKHISKSKIFDKLIKCTPHNNTYRQ